MDVGHSTCCQQIKLDQARTRRAQVLQGRRNKAVSMRPGGTTPKKVCKGRKPSIMLTNTPPRRCLPGAMTKQHTRPPHATQQLHGYSAGGVHNSVPATQPLP